MRETVIKSPKEWRAWAKPIEDGQTAKLVKPEGFPCYASTDVASWNYEEECAKYLYAADIEKLAKELALEV